MISGIAPSHWNASPVCTLNPFYTAVCSETETAASGEGWQTPIKWQCLSGLLCWGFCGHQQARSEWGVIMTPVGAPGPSWGAHMYMPSRLCFYSISPHHAALLFCESEKRQVICLLSVSLNLSYLHKWYFARPYQRSIIPKDTVCSCLTGEQCYILIQVPAGYSTCHRSKSTVLWPVTWGKD